MFVRALVNDIKCQNSGRRFPPRPDVDVDRYRFLHAIPILGIVIERLVRENGLDGHTFTQAFSYPFHLQTTGGCFRSDFEGRLGGIDEERRNRSPAWYWEGV